MALPSPDKDWKPEPIQGLNDATELFNKHPEWHPKLPCQMQWSVFCNATLIFDGLFYR